MKGDFSRIRFTPGQHFTSVLQQQGRVSLDADANEQCAIDEHLRGTQTIDTIGGVGGPRDDAGFRITVEDSSARIHISGGRYYVHGLLCESSATDYMDQPYFVTPSVMDEELLEELRTRKIDGICVELQVWQRLVTALDDSCLLESALGQADTTARLQTVWRVVASPVSMLVKRSSAEELTLVKRSSALEVEKPGKLCATLGNTGDDCSCQPIPPAGYQGLENQLYRVEIHQGGDETTATFKWSRENASIVAAITGSSTVNGQTVLFVDSLGRDANLGFAANQWVEIADDSNEFGDTPNQPGQLWQIASVSAAGQPPSITFNTIISPVNLEHNPRVRRWDQPGTGTAGDMPLSPSFNAPIDIENGIRVTFTPGRYWSGDYWLIPARTASGTIDWPPCGSSGGCFQPADYIHIYTAPLALITSSYSVETIDLRLTEVWAPLVQDLRSFFAPLSASALHIERLGWINDDLMTLDRLLARGLELLLDRNPTSRIDASVFQVSLEIPQSLTEHIIVERTLSPAPPQQPASVAPPASSNAMTLGPAATGVIRQEYVLDGVIELRSEILTWSLPSGGEDDRYYRLFVQELNDLLGLAYAEGTYWYPRARVRLFGRLVYLQTATTSGKCGQTKTLFLDGQCFGKPGVRSDNTPRIDLTLPSGNSAMASDFESWFYLAPLPEVDEVTFNGESSGASITLNANGFGTIAGSVTLVAPPVAATTVSLVADANPATVTLQPSTLTFAAGNTTSTPPTFTVNIQLAPGTSGGPFTCTVTATPQLESGTGEFFSGFGSFNFQFG